MSSSCGFYVAVKRLSRVYFWELNYFFANRRSLHLQTCLRLNFSCGNVANVGDGTVNLVKRSMVYFEVGDSGVATAKQLQRRTAGAVRECFYGPGAGSA